MKFIKILVILFLTTFFATTCQPEKYGAVEIYFTHTVDSEPVQWNQLIYTNTAGNQYQINEIKYFISKVNLVAADGAYLEVSQDEGIHYVDCNLPNTQHWKIENIPLKNFIKIFFTFGLDETDNISNRFTNPPECNFSWPNHLGGGYHYMQINGKFINKENELQNMNIHTGIGQLYDEFNEVKQYVHNCFAVHLPVDFVLEADKTVQLNLNMEIQRWFDTPNLYNFDDFGAGIMQNQEAQKLLKENGRNVFEWQ